MLPILLFVLSGFVPAAAQGKDDRSCYVGAQQLARGDYPAALASLRGVIPNASSTGAELNLRGVAELAAGDLTSALVTFDLAIARDPRLMESRFNRGVTLLRMKRFDEAARVFESVAREDARLRSRAQFHRALAAEGKNDLQLARTWLSRSVSGPDAIAEAYLYSGVVLERLGLFADAGDAYRKYLELRPQSIAATLRFGIVALRAGFQDTAKTMLQRVVRAVPGSREAAEAAKYLVMME